MPATGPETHDEDNLSERIASLASRGLGAEQIAERLGIDVERIAGTMHAATGAAPGDLDGIDKTLADSFPTSDPPPGPGA